jgi:hypothetical protein
MAEEQKSPNVYGSNVARGREESTEESLDHTRETHKTKTGGMGREGTPKDEPGPGAWHHDQEENAPESNDTPNPRPPRNAPLSDEEPS